MGNMNRQLLAAKSYYDEQNYEECLKILISARKNGSDDARKYFGFLLDTDDLFRETSDRFFYLYYSSPAEPEPDQKNGRLVKWQQRLLDLSFKNKFLNFRETKLSIPLLFHNAAVLEDQLAAGKRFQVNSAGDKSFDCDYETIRNADENDPAVRYLTDEFSKKRLLSGLAETELSKRLLSLFRQGKHDLEESGINTLYLTIGILTWPGDDPHSRKEFRAPILLLPVRLIRNSVRDKFMIECSDEDAVINITLLEKLYRDCGESIPGIGIDHLPEDDSGVDVPLILRKFREAAERHSGWKVSEEVWLSSFSFEKFIMWNDLKNRTGSLLANPLVDYLVNHPAEIYDDGIDPVLPENIDRDFRCSDIFAPLSADSSQLSAVLSAARGKSFVLHGPPGTGKSQTIANIIAQCISTGKKVLFVAEKRAALEVVYHRLSQLGLSPFCLELHSNKSGKQEVLEQFREVIELAEQTGPEEWSVVTGQLEREKASLNIYVRELHKIYPIGLSPYQAVSYLVAHPETETYSIPVDAKTMTRQGFEDLKHLCRTIASDVSMLPDSAWDDFRCLECRDWTPAWERNVSSIAEKISDSISELLGGLSHLSRTLGLVFNNQSISAVDELCALAEHLSRGSFIPEHFYDADWPTRSGVLKEFIRLGEHHEAVIASLEASHIVEVLKTGCIPVQKRREQGKDDLFAYHSKDPLGLSSFAPRAGSEWEDVFLSRTRQFVFAANELVSDVRQFFETAGLTFSHFSERAVFHSLHLASLVSAAPKISRAFSMQGWKEFTAAVRSAIAAGRARDAVREQLLEFDLERVMSFDTGAFREKIGKNRNRILPIKKIHEFFICCEMRRLCRNSAKTIEYESIPGLLDRFDEYSEKQKYLNSLDPKYAVRIDGLPNGAAAADWDRIESLLGWGDRLYVASQFYLTDKNDLEIFCNNICQTLAGNEGGIGTPFVQRAGALAAEWDEYAKSQDAFFGVFFMEIHRKAVNSRGRTLAAEFLDKDGDEDLESLPEQYFPGDFLEQLADFVKTHAQLTRLAEKHNLAGTAGTWWKNGRGNWTPLKQTIDYLDKLHSAGDRVKSYYPAQPKMILEDLWSELLHNSDRMLFSYSPLQNEIGKCITLWKKLKGLLQQLRYECRISPAWNPDREKNCLTRYRELADKIRNNVSDLHCWCLWRGRRDEALKLGLGPLIAAIEKREIRGGQLSDIAEHAVIRKFCDEVFALSDPLRNFLGARHEDIISDFRAFDEKYSTLCQKIIVSRLAANLPSFRARRSLPVPGTPLGLLQRELSRQRGHKPIRKLLEEMNAILFDLKPCFLMSPLSVAQFLPADRTVFDLVIFDEASQIPMEDAVGAIARGRQLIVAGDPQQLPPTLFFKKHADDDADENNIIELESLLQECLADNFYQSHLLWHYRSLDESLISFSNAHYYNNTLWTFPSPAIKSGTAVHFRFVRNAIYDRNGTGTNVREAEAVVKEIVRRLKTASFKKRSLGVVTFSVRQQILIEDLLDEARRRHPELEYFFDPANPEPVFVKNLENVQGDERDVIFFSIGYGPDADGKVYMNFGPLNIDKGERRLNVAITRAKEEIVVFSSIHADDIDLARTAKQGPRDLKDFLAFAETGLLNNAVPDNASGEYGGLLENEVADFLRNRGFEVRTGIGYSAYKIDLAVVSPRNPDRFVLGIECDGGYYSSSKSARDRDKLRGEILKRLGWNLCHVWSVSWWTDRKKAEKKLLDQLDAAIASEHNGNPDLPQETEPDMDVLPEPASAVSDEEPAGEPSAGDGMIYPETDYSEEAVFQSCAQSTVFAPYMRTELFKILQRQARCIISKEGPIVENLLLSRLLQAWGFSRPGKKIRDIFSAALSRMDAEKQSDGQRVYWPPVESGVTPQNFTAFRRPGAGCTEARTLSQIPLIEIRNAMLWYLREYRAFSDRDALFRGTGKLFGFSRLTEQARSYYQFACEMLQREGVVS